MNPRAATVSPTNPAEWPANGAPLSLHIPAPKWRPGDAADYSDWALPAAGSAPRPPVDADPAQMRDLAYDLIRVLDDEGAAVGPWAPQIAPETLRRGLRTMVLTRAFDERMFLNHRQGKTSFYIKSTGEEAVAAAAQLALQPDDMCFTTYRQAALLIGRGYPLLDMANQVYGNAADPLKGRQLPCLYSSKAHGFFTLSGNIATQFCQAVGWGMASAYKGGRSIAAAWIGEGSSAEQDFQQALIFAAVYRAPVILNVVNNQWAISSFQGIAGGEATTFAAKGVGYGLPSLRVDGNDFLAVYAATQWAEQRARANLGATLIEMFTYRAGPHSTSDDPSRYRAADEATLWPLGDPIERLKRHLIALGEWSEDQQAALQAEATEQVRAVAKEAEAIGLLGQNPPSTREMFEEIFETPDWRLNEQRREVGV
ncbi:MAG: hypothetical protein JWQ29_1406 [Phenylobacterium sp.]|nr:hypothetical protein [Phenylobacterium sp.]